MLNCFQLDSLFNESLTTTNWMEWFRTKLRSVCLELDATVGPDDPRDTLDRRIFKFSGGRPLLAGLEKNGETYYWANLEIRWAY